MEVVAQQVLLAAISAFLYFLLRPTVRQLRDAGAQPWTVGYYLAFPGVLWVAVQLYAAGLIPVWTAIALTATLVVPLASVDATIRVTGGRRPLATFVFKVIETEAAVLRARAADPASRDELAALVADLAWRLDVGGPGDIRQR